jgi:hypothetical protein
MIIKIGDIFIDKKGNHQKCIRELFYSGLYNEFCYLFHTGKAEYASTVISEWKKTNLQYLPGEQITLF